MRQRHTTQGSIFWIRPEHEITKTFTQIEQWLDLNPVVLDWIGKDLDTKSKRGRPGMTCDQVLRCALVLQYRQCGFRGLEFLLRDSLSFQHFCRIDPFEVPSKSALAANIKAIRPATWRKLHRHFVNDMNLTGFESGSKLRIDSTVAETNILFPTDSKLLNNSIRLMVKMLKSLRPMIQISFVDHRRRAKRHSFAATMAKTNALRYRHYKMLLQDVDETRLALEEARKALEIKAQPTDSINELLSLVSKVMSQATRRVVLEETVPVEEKVVSLHEAHSDIILKGGRDIQFGHKLNLSTGASGLVIDVAVEHGNPSDRSRLMPMLRRHQRLFGTAPESLAADGGYASQDNLRGAKSLGVNAVAFDKRVNLSVEEMTGDDWLYRELKRFRAGIEAGISYLKRCFGLRRIFWKGWNSFQSNVYLAVFTHNLIVWARSG